MVRTLTLLDARPQQPRRIQQGGNTTGVSNIRLSLDREQGVRSYATAYYCQYSNTTNYHVLTNAHVRLARFFFSRKQTLTAVIVGDQDRLRELKLRADCHRRRIHFWWEHVHGRCFEGGHPLRGHHSDPAASRALRWVLLLRLGPARQLKSAGGIGNASVLQNHGIKTLVDLPGVGEQFQEHLFVATQWQLQPGIETFGAYTFHPYLNWYWYWNPG